MANSKSFTQTTIQGNPVTDNRSMAMFFSMIEEGLANAKSRVLEGSYIPDFNIPPQNMNHIQEGNQGFIDVTNPHPFGVHDMYNAYFDMDVSVDVILVAKTGATVLPAGARIFVGFKNAFDIIDRFIWKVSGSDIQTEVNCHKFGTLHNLAISQDVMEKNPFTYTSSKILDANSGIGKCGTIVTLGGDVSAGSSITRNVQFKLMIPMFMFDIFATIRYLPRAFGEWLFNFIPTSANMVWGVSGTMAGYDGGGGFLTKDFYGNGGLLNLDYSTADSKWPDGLVSVSMNNLKIENWTFRSGSFILLESEYNTFIQAFPRENPLRVGVTNTLLTNISPNVAPERTLYNTINVI